MSMNVRQNSASDIFISIIGLCFIVIAVMMSSALAGLSVAVLAPKLGNQTWLLLAALLMAIPGIVFCWAKFDSAVFIAFLLSSVVRVEPAPFDVLIVLLLGVGLFNGKLSTSTLGGSSFIHATIWLFILSHFIPLRGGLLFIFISLYMLILMYFFKMYVTSEHRMRVLVTGYWSAALIVTLSVMLGLVGWGSDLTWYAQGTRAQGFFKDPNVFSTFLIPILLITFDEIIDPALLRWPVWIKWGSLLLFAAGIFFAYSRAAWGNVGLALLIYGGLKLLKGHHTARLLTTFSLAALFSVLTIVTILTLRPDMLHIFRWRTQAVQTYDIDRFARHEEGLILAMQSPLGIGPNRFPGAHQLYVKTLVEQGVLGLVSLLALLMPLTFLLLRAAWREREKVWGVSPVVLFAVLVGLLVNSMVIDTIHWRHFFLILALGWVVTTSKREHKTEETDETQRVTTKTIETLSGQPATGLATDSG